MAIAAATAMTVLAAPIAAMAAPDCQAIDTKANEAGSRILGYEAGRTVIGEGRLRFYTAPALNCVLQGVFILPGETVYSYVEYGGFTAIMYMNPKTGADYEGWVLTARLQPNGVGIAPKQ